MGDVGQASVFGVDDKRSTLLPVVSARVWL